MLKISVKELMVTLFRNFICEVIPIHVLEILK